jgi:hypothetical protein
MSTFIKTLLDRLETELEEARSEASPVRRYEISIRLTQASIREVKKYNSRHPFKTPSDEIHYFKREAPSFLEKTFFFAKAKKLELFRFSADKEFLISYIGTELKNIHFFFQRHAEFIQYFLVDGSHMDEKYFTRKDQEDWNIDEMAGLSADNMCSASYLIGWIRANQQYRPLLEKEMCRLQHGETTDLQPVKVYGFKGSGADATEIIDAWNKLRLITVDGKEATQKQLKEMWELFFRMNLGNISENKRINHARKKEKTPFLNKMIRALEAVV